MLGTGLIKAAIYWALNTYQIILLVRCILSFFRTPSYTSPWLHVWNFFYALTEPVLKPIRNLLGRHMGGRIDFSPLILMLLLSLAARLIMRLL